MSLLKAPKIRDKVLIGRCVDVQLFSYVELVNGYDADMEHWSVELSANGGVLELVSIRDSHYDGDLTRPVLVRKGPYDEHWTMYQGATLVYPAKASR